MTNKFEIRNSAEEFLTFVAENKEEGELPPEATVAKFATVVNRGIRGEVEDDLNYYQRRLPDKFRSRHPVLHHTGPSLLV